MYIIYRLYPIYNDIHKKINLGYYNYNLLRFLAKYVPQFKSETSVMETICNPASSNPLHDACKYNLTNVNNETSISLQYIDGSYWRANSHHCYLAVTKNQEKPQIFFWEA